MDTNFVTVAQSAAAAQSATMNTVLVALISFFGILVSTIGTVVLARINKASKEREVVIRKIDAMKEHANEVSRKLENSEAVQSVKLHEIHMDVNSKMGEKKRQLWEARKALAAYTHLKEHESAARDAEREYIEHIEAQELVDVRVRLVLEAERVRIAAIAHVAELTKAKE